MDKETNNGIQNSAILIPGVLVFKFLRDTRPNGTTEGMLIEYSDSLGQEQIIPREYGLRLDSFHIFTGTIKRDQTLSTILQEYEVSGKNIHALAEASEGVFDLRKLRHGKPYKVFCSRDSLEEALYLVYEHTPVDYVFFSLADSTYVLRQEKEVTVRMREASGFITSSLWNTMLDHELDPMLAFELSEIYASLHRS